MTVAKKRPYDQLIDQLMMTAGPASSADQAVQAARQRINQNRGGRTVAGRAAGSVGMPQMTSTAGAPASRVNVPRGGANIPPTTPTPTLGNQLMPGLGPMGALPPGTNPNWGPGGTPQGPAGGMPTGAPALPQGRVQATYTPPSRPPVLELPAATSAPAVSTSTRATAGAAKAASAAAGTAGSAARPMGAAASLADDVAAIAGLGGGGGGAASAAGAAAPAATGLARLTGGIGTRAALGRVGLGAGAGMLASQLVPDVDDTNTDSALRGALTGAGLGASIGSFIPIPGVGTLTGGLIGGAAGGLIGMFGPKDDASGANAVAEALQANSTKLDQALAQFQLDPQSQQALQAQLVPMLMNAQSREQVDAAFTQVAAQLPAIIQQDQVYKQQARAEQERLVRAAAMQSLLAPAMQKWSDQADVYAQQASAMQRSAADQLQDPTLAAVFRQAASQLPLTTAQQNQSSIRQLALADAAYSQQAQLMREQQQQAAVPSTNDLIAQLLGQ